MRGRPFTGAHVARLAGDRRRYGRRFVSLPIPDGNRAIKAWRNAEFLVQLYDDDGHPRLSVNRTRLAPNRQDWADGITWDELQQIKTDVGYAELWAIEIYPPDNQTINDANLRHLWLLEEPPAQGWRFTPG